MSDQKTTEKLDQIARLLKLNLVIMILGSVGLIAGLLPQIIKVSNSAERIEQRFQQFADEVEPVVTAGAGKAIETITKIDADQLSETATESSDQWIKAAGEKAKRYLESKENK